MEPLTCPSFEPDIPQVDLEADHIRLFALPSHFRNRDTATLLCPQLLVGGISSGTSETSEADTEPAENMGNHRRTIKSTPSSDLSSRGRRIDDTVTRASRVISCIGESADTLAISMILIGLRNGFYLQCL